MCIFCLDINVSYTVGLCMISSGEATGCLTKQIETVQPDASKFIININFIHHKRNNIIHN